MITGILEYWRWHYNGCHAFDKAHKEKLDTIKKEAYAFTAYEDGDGVPDGKGGIVSFEFVPECIYWKRWVDRFGLPYGGGWMKNPQLFMREIDAVRRGEEQYKQEQPSTNKLLAQMNANLNRLINAITQGR